MSIARIDVHEHDDTELGALVRDAYATGRRVVTLFDSSEPDLRAATWVDGKDGLYRMKCAQDHAWLTRVERSMLVSDCPTCGLPGEWMDD